MCVGIFSWAVCCTFNFGFNESILDAEDKLYLDDLANLMKLNPRLELEIVGHADNIGTENANKKISLQSRAIIITSNPYKPSHQLLKLGRNPVALGCDDE